MGHNTHDANESSRTSTRYCTACGEPIEPGWDFCDACGASVRAQTTKVEPPPKPLRRQRPEFTTPPADEDIIYLPGYTPDAIEAAALERPKRRTRRTRRKHLRWRRPLIFVPLVLLAIILSGTGAAVWRTNGVMSSLQTISTPPPQITDQTYLEEPDPDMPGGPITVNTGPAREAIQEVSAARNLPQPQNTGIGARLQNIPSGAGDIAKAASVASGIGTGGSQEGFTVLVMGVDAQPGSAIDIGVRPDVMMLVRFVPDSHSCRMLAIPRDTRVELPGYGKSKINHALMVGGVPYQLLVIEDFIDQPIDHYLLIDFQAFEQAVNTVGGITVDIDENLEKDGELRYTAGSHAMNGQEALAYARFRTPSDEGDIGRVQRRWSILGGLARAAQGRDLITDVNTIVPTVEEHIRTDLTLTEMATIASDYGDHCLDIDRDQIAMTEGTRVRFDDPILDQRLYYNVVQESTVQQRVEELLRGTQATPDPDVQATPSPEVEATPAARWSPGQWRSASAKVGRT